MRRTSMPIPVTGGSALLVIFAVLCLTIFALLSISTVQADNRLGDAAAKAAIGYYEAEREADEILAGLRRGELYPQVEQMGDLYSYVCTVSDTQELFVEALISPTSYEIVTWQLRSSADWQPDDGLTVWLGD